MCHLSPVTCHLTTTLSSFTCYENPRKFGDAAWGLLINEVKKKQEKNSFQFLVKQYLGISSSNRSLHSTMLKSYTNRMMDIATLRLNWPRALFSENILTSPLLAPVEICYLLKGCEAFLEFVNILLQIKDFLCSNTLSLVI